MGAKKLDIALPTSIILAHLFGILLKSFVVAIECIHFFTCSEVNYDFTAREKCLCRNQRLVKHL